ncbi:AMP-binding protein [Nonomuraea sp. NPDC050328]|uniref:AMP-binding protein n=1 Tax=Nonomuraea sp. NPDC050328 TaxID=3364361 RepID=UPI0037A63688
MPVAPQVLRHAAARPHALALRGPSGSLSYGELAARVQGAARTLLATRDRRGSLGGSKVLAVTLADPVEVLVAALAADLAGVTPLLCDPSWDAARRERILEAVPVDGRLDAPLAETPGAPIVPRPAPDDRVWACFSSGSTGRPRAVVRTRASWSGSFPHVDRLAGVTSADTVLVPGPLVSSLYGFAAVHALAAGAAALVPGRWQPAALAGHLREATVAHLVPHALPALLEARPGGPLRTVLVGGASLPAGSRAAAERAGLRVLAYYGATELSFVAVDVDGSGLRAFPEVDIEVRGRPLGEVWARSPWLSEGYLADGAGPLRVDERGWMSVGDVAEPYDGPDDGPADSRADSGAGDRADDGAESGAGGRTDGRAGGGVLRVRGRGDGAIQTGGATVVPEDVEAVLREAPGVRDVVVVGSPHPVLGSVVTAVVEGRPARDELEAVARAGLDPAQRPRLWYAMPALPRTPAGKPARGQVSALAATGDPALRKLA